MGESHDFMSLDWVHGDIEDTLARAQESLEAYLANTSDTDQLQACIEAIHQVHGSLQMAGLSGALMLTQEVEALLHDLVAGDVDDSGAAHEALAQALVHLPPYLTRVQHETVEHPLLLLAPANQIRKQRGQEAISAFSYFTPDLGVQRALAGSDVRERFEQEDSAALKKVRQVFQFALVGLIRNEDVNLNLGRVSKALARLQQLCKGAPVNQGWEIGAAVIEGLVNGAIELESRTIDLLRRIDVAIKILIEAGADGLDTRPDDDLLKGLLYQLAKSPAGMPRVDAIKQEYQLDQFHLGASGGTATLIAGPDKQAIESVVTALSEELQSIKDSIDLYVRSEAKGEQDLSGLQPGLSQIASTLVLLNLEAPRIIVQEQISILADRDEDGDEIGDAALLGIAEALLYVEAELDSLLESVASRSQNSVSVHANAATETVVTESLKGLRKAKDLMHDFLASDGDFELLHQVPGVLRGSYGGLSILALPTVPQLVFACGQYIEDDIIASEKVPEGSAIETLAEVLATVEFYLEGYINSHAFNENILTQAKQGMATLGYPVEQVAGISSEDEHFGMPGETIHEFESGLDEPGETPASAATQADNGIPAAAGVSPEASAVESAHIIDFGTVRASTGDAEPPVDQVGCEQQMKDTEEASEAPSQDARELAATSAGVIAPDSADEPFIDAEILEIFIEEAQEVFEQIDSHWPVYAADFAKLDALKEVRRAFHTLKGSGRMVGAGAIGELGWSVENMLNQLLEGVIEPNEGICGLVNTVMGVLPDLLEAFGAQREPGFDLEPLMNCADALSRGEAAETPDLDALMRPDAARISGEDSAPLEPEVDATVASTALDQDEQPAAQEFVESPGIDHGTPEMTAATDECADDSVHADAGEVCEGVYAEDVDVRPAESSRQGADNEIYTIFGREAGQHLAVIDEFTGAMAGLDSADITDELYRALHTLKGSASMAELPVIAELAATAEGLVKLMRERATAIDAEFAGLLTEMCSVIRGGLLRLEDFPLESLAGGAELREKLQVYAAGRPELRPDADTLSQSQPSALALLLQQYMDSICLAQGHFENWQADPRPVGSVFVELRTAVSRLSASLGSADDERLPALLNALDGTYAQLADLGEPANSELLAALADSHELLITGLDSAAAGQEIEIDLAPVQQLADALAKMSRLQNTEDELAGVETHITAVPEDSVAGTAEHDAGALDEPPGESDSIASYDGVQLPVQEAQDTELVEIFLEEAEEIFEAIASAKQDWINDNTNAGAIDALQRSLHTLKGSSRMAGMVAMGDLSHELETIYEDVAAARIAVTPNLFELVHECDDRLADMLAQVKNGEICSPAVDLITRVRDFHGGKLESSGIASEIPMAGATVVFDTALGATVEADSATLDTFFANAASLMESIGAGIKALKAGGDDAPALQQRLQEDVTALKDASYVAGVHEIGDLSQIFLEVLINFEPANLGEEAAQAELSDWLERLDACYQEAKQSAQDVAMPEPPEATGAGAPAARPSHVPAQDTVRVSSGLLEQLVNLGGETSVSRSRIEQQVSNFGYAIEEMGATVERLREQLRRMEIETEAQILFRQEQEGPEHQGFDPLEMDRYSRMQELSRSLVESVSDLFDLKDTLRDRARYTENLLLQQSRINTELQEGLMKTRMVPFARLVARLRRVVRQVGQEVSKQVEFTLKNVDVELDRSLLENMTAPLEHMLRNAIDHGIESTELRRQAGKNETGSVQLSLGRDGGDVVLELADDGAGIDIASVRAKAVERGLIEQDTELTDDEVVQFILHAGFSTARQVTQISGRGVGLDVVNSEIKKLGGSIHIHTEPGRGSRFVVRVPFAVSVNSALMVNIGDETFALPLSTIEGVVRVSPYELEEYYRDNGPRFEYAGQQYDLKYLGEFVGHRNNLQAQNQALPLPVILIRTTEGSVALQVDDITSSREIVVKPLGSQLGAMPGLSGATILGDGRVVLILDMPAMVRAKAAVKTRQAEVETVDTAESSASELRVMVVDDSVTVRKVASRLLERHGMEVIVAKDGVEAMTKLQDTLPSVMLLDIEMPRMDGFELASLMRHDERLQEVPIVMITSRTGDKHRERALEIGVNRFMGKPFQEDDLLDAIGALTTFEREQFSRND